MMKHVASENASRIHHTSISYDPQCYSNFLRFYDGICEWEEDSKTPVLHITWAKQLVNSLSRFDPTVRKLIHLKSESGEESSSSSESEDESEEEKEIVQDENRNQKKAKKSKRNDKNDNENKDKNMNGQNDGEQIKTISDIEELVSKVEDDSQSEPNPNIEALAQACSESILNPEYLLGSGEPFTAVSTASVVTTSSDTRVDLQEFLSTKSNGSPFMGMSVDSMLKAESPSDMMMYKKQQLTNGVVTSVSQCSPTPISPHTSPIPDLDPTPEPVEEKIIFEPVTLCLKSHKMLGLRKIFTSVKCNYSAIQLQLTAQSQVHFKNHKRSTEFDLAMARKRPRRE